MEFEEGDLLKYEHYQQGQSMFGVGKDNTKHFFWVLDGDVRHFNFYYKDSLIYGFAGTLVKVSIEESIACLRSLVRFFYDIQDPDHEPFLKIAEEIEPTKAYFGIKFDIQIFLLKRIQTVINYIKKLAYCKKIIILDECLIFSLFVFNHFKQIAEIRHFRYNVNYIDHIRNHGLMHPDIVLFFTKSNTAQEFYAHADHFNNAFYGKNVKKVFFYRYDYPDLPQGHDEGYDKIDYFVRLNQNKLGILEILKELLK